MTALIKFARGIPRSALVLWIAALLFHPAFLRAQPQVPIPKSLAFEVASVKPSAPPPAGRSANYRMTGGPGSKDPTHFSCENFDLSSLMQMAYDVPDYRLSTPAWTSDVKFDITAIVPEGATREQFRLMLQNLLATRFQLAIHRSKKDMPIYELVVAKGGPKFKESSAQVSEAGPAIPNTLTTDAEGYPVLPPGQTALRIARDHARARGAAETMEHFASTLGGQLREPVVDATHLNGKYDFVVSWLPGDFAHANDNGPTLQQALSEQLGLALVRKRGPVDVWIVDHVEKTPLEN